MPGSLDTHAAQDRAGRANEIDLAPPKGFEGARLPAPRIAKRSCVTHAAVGIEVESDQTIRPE